MDQNDLFFNGLKKQEKSVHPQTLFCEFFRFVISLGSMVLRVRKKHVIFVNDLIEYLFNWKIPKLMKPQIGLKINPKITLGNFIVFIENSCQLSICHKVK